MRKTTGALIIGAGLVACGSVMATPCANDAGPHAAVQGYLTAMQNHKFTEAYDFVTKTMTDGKSREDWAAQQKLFYEGGEVNIFGIDIRKAIGTDDDASCAKKASVPNILKSRDKFNNQGTTEFETYTVVKDGDKWRVDSQDTLSDPEAIKKVFPGEAIPEFRGKY